MHLFEQLSRVAGDYFGLEMVGNCDTQCCFSDSGGTEQDQQRWTSCIVQRLQVSDKWTVGIELIKVRNFVPKK